MATPLGIKIGAVSSVAALATSGKGAPAATSVPTALHLAEDGPRLAATGGAPAPQVDDFAQRVGDPVPILASDGSSHCAADLVATTAELLISTVRGQGEEVAESVALAYPTTWRDYTVATLRDSLQGTSAAAALLVPEAAAIAAALSEPDDTSAALLVYDLGGSGLSVAAVQPGQPPQVLGVPARTTEVSGELFDDLVFAHIVTQLPAVDGEDPASLAELAALRARTKLAREVLSADTETTVPVCVAGKSAELRLVRSEVEELLRAPLADSLTLVARVLQDAGLTIADIGAVLVAGGLSATPLVAEFLSTELGKPIRIAPDPAFTSARGAARLLPAPSAAGPAAAVAVSNQAAPPSRALAPLTLAPASRGVELAWHRRLAMSSAGAVAVLVLAAGSLTVGTLLFPSSGTAADVSAQGQPPATSTTPVAGVDTAGVDGAPAPTAPRVVEVADIAGTDGNGGAPTDPLAAEPAAQVSAPGTAETLPRSGAPAAPGEQALPQAQLPAPPQEPGAPGLPLPADTPPLPSAVPAPSVPAVQLPSAPVAPAIQAPAMPQFEAPTVPQVPTVPYVEIPSVVTKPLETVGDIGSGLTGAVGGAAGTVVGGLTDPLGW